ncbi:MAG: hypothetical protein HY922_07285 [Elusimicrobia bacterium]|nr:hypothetical protein [Elusimicrobiota bacterium]
MAEFLWKAEDYEGVPVALEASVWRGKILHPILWHPEVQEYPNEIRLSVQSPEAVFPSVRDPRTKLFYRSGLTAGRYAGYWIVVVVKYVREPEGLRGYVSTAFISRNLKKRGDKLWPKSTS